MKPQKHLADWFEIAAHLCGAATASIGALALAGWVTGLRELAGVSDQWIPMAPNTAVAFIALGSALSLVQHGGHRSILVARLLSATVCTVVLLRLSESVTGADLGVDRWVFNVPAESMGTIPVGQMASVTALSFLCASVALLLIAFNRWWLVAEALAVVVALVGLVFFLGYLYQAPLLYRETMIPMSVTTAAAFCFLGAGTLVAVAGRDLAARRRAAQQLQLQAAALNAAATSILITDRQGTILWCNPAFSELTGYTAAEAVGQNPRLLKSGKHDPAFYQHLWRRITAGRIWHGEIINKRKDGSLYTQEITITPVRDARGQIAHFIAIEQDITLRKRAEAELRRARDAAEAANRAKSLFLANMSHELRTPLNSVIGFANILLKNRSGKLDATDLGFLERIAANGKHLLDMIGQVLELSDIEAQRVQLRTATVALDRMVPEVIAGFEFQLRDRPVTLSAELPDRIAPLETDEVKLKQVLVTLIGNALKFTERGSVVVRVMVDEESRQPVRVDVADTGIGIPQDRLAAIFEAFQQADSSMARKYGGVGLGLTLAKALCDLMGHRIEVRSEAGKGSTFSVILPARPEPNRPDLDSSADPASPR
ncbi:MAG: PAS domain S-box protein [Verrucomicrobia bacterium]|nr:PAS domain S-box protein [Verrucomicrobiota bacterium]